LKVGISKVEVTAALTGDGWVWTATVRDRGETHDHVRVT
jgi:hypothetical protein